MAMNKPVGIPLVEAQDTSRGGIGPNVKIEKIMLFSTADRNTGVFYGAPPAMDGYDITRAVIELEITESIHSLAVVGSVSIIDNFNLFQDARIHGQEKIYINFKRYNPESKQYDLDLQRDFLVVNLRNYERGEFRAAYTLEFASPHIYWDKVKRIGRAYGYTDVTAENSVPSGDIAGSAEAITAWRKKYTDEANKKIKYADIHDILGDPDSAGNNIEGETLNTLEYPEQFIYDILTTDLEMPPEKVWLYGYHPGLTSRNSFSRMKVVIPNWRPFQTIKWLIRNAFSKQENKIGHPWFCYDTLLAGIRIEPYSMLIKKQTPDSNGMNPDDIELYSTGRISKYKEGKYIYNPGYVSKPGTDAYATQIRRKIFEMKIGFSFDQFTKAGNGSYSTQEWYVDVATKFVFPNLYKLLHESRIDYNEESFVAGKDRITGHYLGYAKDIGENAIDFAKTNYTYFVPFNTALHGTTEQTYPYNEAYGFQGETVEWQGGSEGETAIGPGSGSGGEGAKATEEEMKPDAPPPKINPAPAGQSGAVWPTSPYKKTMGILGISQGTWDTFRKTIAFIESGNKGYNITGGYNNAYDGAYQMGAAAKADAARILGIPVPSREKFRSDPDLQEKMFDAWTYVNHTYMLTKPASAKYKSMSTNEKLGVLGYAHNQGAGGASDWLRTGKSRYDAFGTIATKYYNAVLGNLGGSSSVDGTSPPTKTESTTDTTRQEDGTVSVPSQTTPIESQTAVSSSSTKVYTQTMQATTNGDPKDLGKVGRTADMIRRNMDFMQHTIKVMGDFGLNPGMTLDIEVQKAVDPVLLEKYMEGRRDEPSLIDEYISGTYFVTECTHVFAEKDFYTFATINRDSSSLKLD